MSYKIIDYQGETIQGNFRTATGACMYMQHEFSEPFIHDLEMKVIREDKDEIHNNLYDQE